MPDDNIQYEISTTTQTAEWVKDSLYPYFRCSNCRHSESFPYETNHVVLGRFCPNCGFKMLNHRTVFRYVDYGD